MRGRDIRVSKVLEEELKQKEDEQRKLDQRRFVKNKMLKYFEKVKETMPLKVQKRAADVSPIIEDIRKRGQGGGLNKRYDRSVIIGSSS